MSNIPLKIFQSLFNSTLTYFIITSVVWGFVYLVPSVLALSGASLYFSLLGIIGLAVIFTLPITIADTLLMTPEDEKNNIPYLTTILIISFLLFGPISWSASAAVPFFISILCGASPFIATSLLSLSAVNISVLVICAYNFLSSIPALFIVSKVDEAVKTAGYKHLANQYNAATPFNTNTLDKQNFPYTFDQQNIFDENKKTLIEGYLGSANFTNSG